MRAFDGTTVSMPREPALFVHFGVHQTRMTTVRYPLARFCSLLAVGTCTLVDYRFGPFLRSKTTLVTEMLGSVGPGDLVLAGSGHDQPPHQLVGQHMGRELRPVI